MTQKAPAQPPAPDPRATAQAQSEFNSAAARENAQLNRVNQVTPQGSLSYGRNAAFDQFIADNVERDRGTYAQEGRDFNEEAVRRYYSERNPNAEFTATTTLSPEQRRLYDQSVAGQELYGDTALSLLRATQGNLSRPLDYTPRDRTGELRRAPDFTGIGDPNQAREAAQAAVLSRVNPDIERERAALESRLAAQGITMGSQAWNTGMQDWHRMANDARMQAVLAGGQEQSRMFGLGLSQAQLANATAGQAAGMDQSLLQQLLAVRTQPLNEAAALLSGQQVQNPQFQNVPQVAVQAPDYEGAVGRNYAGQIGAWNANTQRIGAENSAVWNALGQAGGAAATAAFRFSDRRLKRDVQRIGTGAHGLPVYRFAYLWGEMGEGYMADEVAAVAPHAVHIGADGFARVDYGAV